MQKTKIKPSISVEIFEQAFASRCYGVVINIRGECFISKDREFFPEASYNILSLPEAQQKAAQIALLLGQKTVEVDSTKKELIYKNLRGIKFRMKKQRKPGTAT